MKLVAYDLGYTLPEVHMHMKRALITITSIAAGLAFLYGCGDGSSKQLKADFDKSCEVGEVIGLDGSCLIGCPEGQLDVDGKCKIDESSCETGKIMVNGVCTAKDSCGPGQKLIDGVCTCPDGKEMSGGFCVTKKKLTIQTTLAFPMTINLGDSYKAEFKAVYGSGDYTWATLDLPDGLVLAVSADSKTASISGKPIKPEVNHVYSLTVTEKADSSKSYTKKISISVVFVAGIGVLQEPTDAGKPWTVLNVSDPNVPLSVPDGQAVMLKVPAGKKSYTWACDGSEKEDASGIPCVGQGHAGMSLAKEPKPNRVWELNSAGPVFCANPNDHPWCTKPVRNYEVGDNIRYLVPDDNALTVELKALAIGVTVDSEKIDKTIQSITFVPEGCAHFKPVGDDITATYLLKYHKFITSVITWDAWDYESWAEPSLSAIAFTGDPAKDPFTVSDEKTRKIYTSSIGIPGQFGGKGYMAFQMRGTTDQAGELRMALYGSPIYNVVISDSCTPANTIGFKLTVNEQ